jgi:predicted nucleotidyltransferase
VTDIRTDRWQLGTAHNLSAVLALDSAVRALIVFGSAASRPAARLDGWSDLDLLVVVKDGATDRFVSSLDWLEPLGGIFAWEHHPRPFRHTLRVCLDDFRRLDLVIADENAVEQLSEWARVPFVGQKRVLFSSSTEVDKMLMRPSLPLVSARPSPTDFAQMANTFWFKGAKAVERVVRGDLLVGLHLSLDQVRDCLALGMMLREREGTADAAVLDQLHGAARPFTPLDILDSLEHSAHAFDALAEAWSPVYWPRTGSLQAWIAAARAALAAG